MRAGPRALSVCSWAVLFSDHGIGPDRKRDVFEVLLAQIGELNANLAPDVIVSGRRDADAPGFCDAFKPRRNIHPIPKDVVRLNNYVTDIDAHTESNAPVLHIAVSQVVDAGLELHSSSNGFDRARKLRQEPIASDFDIAAGGDACA